MNEGKYKECNICKIIKPLLDFHISHANKKDGRYSYCKLCKRNKYLQNREPALERSKIWRKNNHEFYLSDQKTRYLVDSENRKSTSMAYYEDNKDHLMKWQGEYHKQKRKVNTQFRVTCRLKSGFTSFIIGKGLSKRQQEICGCTLDEVKRHIESKFTIGMNWGNRGRGRGKWNIDHIKPYTDFDLTKESEIKTCCHYTNLQPLWWIDNIRKSNK